MIGSLGITNNELRIGWQGTLSCDGRVASAFPIVQVRVRDGTHSTGRIEQRVYGDFDFDMNELCICLCYLSHLSDTPISTSQLKPQPQRVLYLSFFFGRSWFVWPHFFFRQFVARGGRRA